MKGRALLLSSDDEPLDAYEAALAAGGFDVHRCNDTGSPVFPCAGLVTGTCPLDLDGGVDVAVDVRQHPWPLPMPREMGVTCALRANVPVLVVSEHRHPFTEHGVTTAHPALDLVGASEVAILHGLDAMRKAVTDEVGAVLDRHDCGHEPFAVEIDRRLGRVHVRITASVPDRVAAMAATRAAVVVRRVDDAARSVELEVVSPSGVPSTGESRRRSG